MDYQEITEFLPYGWKIRMRYRDPSPRYFSLEKGGVRVAGGAEYGRRAGQHFEIMHYASELPAFIAAIDAVMDDFRRRLDEKRERERVAFERKAEEGRKEREAAALKALGLAP